jgi:hypothetical protein
MTSLDHELFVTPDKLDSIVLAGGWKYVLNQLMPVLQLGGMGYRRMDSKVGGGRARCEVDATQAPSDERGISQVATAYDAVDILACQICSTVAGTYVYLNIGIASDEFRQGWYDQMSGDGRAHLNANPASRIGVRNGQF